MVIAATRMYRSLQYHASHDIEPDSLTSDLQWTRNSRLVSKTKDPSAIQIPAERSEVTVHTAYEAYPMSRMNHSGSYPDKPHELVIDNKVEGWEGENLNERL